MEEKKGKDFVAMYVQGVKHHDWKKSPTLKLRGTSLAKEGESYVYTRDEGTARAMRDVIRFRQQPAPKAPPGS